LTTLLNSGFEKLQIKVSKILACGFVFSLRGIGSLIAFILALKARQIIKRSNGEIGGIKAAGGALSPARSARLFYRCWLFPNLNAERRAIKQRFLIFFGFCVKL
jgi:hypothetical protein